MNKFLRRYGIWDDDFAWIDSFFPVRSYTLSGRVYNPETHDLVPKKEFVDREIAETDEALVKLNNYYEEKKEELLKRKEDLIKQRK